MALAGCTSTPAQPPTPVNSATAPPPGPVVSGHVLVFSPDEHEVDQSGRMDQSKITDDAVAAGMSPDGKTLAYVTQNSQLVLRDLGTKAEKKVIVTVGRTPLSPGKCVRFSPDGKRLALLSQAGGLYVTSLAGAATKIDVPKREQYTQTDGGILAGPAPDAPAYNVYSTVTCGRWLDADRLVFDRVAEMPNTVTIENGQQPADLPPDTTTVATVSPVRLTDSPKQWALRDRCGAHLISSVRTDETTTDYVVDAKPLGDVTPAGGKLPSLRTTFIPGSCDVLMIAPCSTDRCATSRFTPSTGKSQDLAPLHAPDHGEVPGLDADEVAWNPDHTRFAANSDGYVYVYDLATGAWTFVLAAGIVGGHGDKAQVLGWAGRPTKSTPSERNGTAQARWLVSLGNLASDLVVADLGGRLGRRVDHADHAGREDLGRGHRQVVGGVAVVEEPATLSRRHRMHQQAQLVDQARGEQLLHHRDRAGDEDPLDAGVGLQRGDRRRELAVEQLRVAPGELQRLPRNHNLPYVAQLFRESRVVATGGLPAWPGARETVVGLPADEQHVGGVVVLSHRAAHVVVEVGKVPVEVDLGHTVGRDEQRGDDLGHDAAP